MIPAVADEARTAQYLSAFTDQGYAHFRDLYSPPQVEMFNSLYEHAVADWQFTNGTEEKPDAVAGMLERFPRQVFPALAHPLLLGFAEAVMGPFVQLDSAVINSDPPVSPDQESQPVMWHRDRFGSVPQGVYTRPASIVFLSYLQSMTSAVGPLRVIPGSHRTARMLSDTELRSPLPDEILIRAEPGEVVAIHHNLLHSGTRNTSKRDRRFLGFIFNLSALRPEDNFAGPNCRALIDSAQRARDRRLLRFLGEDPLIFPRQNSGFTAEHEKDWKRWRDEDTAFADQAEAVATTSHRVRSALAVPQPESRPTYLGGRG